MEFGQWKSNISKLWSENGATEADVLVTQNQILMDPDLEVHDKGYLLACFISHPCATTGTVVEQVALLGGLFEIKELVLEDKANELLEEARALLRKASPE